MARINSKRKGGNFELQIAHFLTYIASSPWHRVGVSSGARATTQGLQNGFQGDVFSTKYPNTIIECKHWKELSVSDLYNPVSLFANAIKQTKKESQGKDWILFVKANNQGILMVHHLFSTPETTEIIRAIPYKGLLVNEDNLCIKKIQTSRNLKKKKT